MGSRFMYEDLTGMRFGRLVAIEPASDGMYGKSDGHKVWKCMCDCGNVTYTISSALKAGNTRSCGCLRKEKSRETMKKHRQNRRKK